MSDTACGKGSDSLYRLVLGVLVLAAASTYLFRQVYDPDFFWHLKTGEWIWQHRMLPSSDPFTQTALRHATPHQLYLLTSYWLSQILFFAAWSLLDWWGIYFVRLMILVSIVLLCAKRKGEDSVVSICAIAIMLVCMLEVYPIERPQYFSFVFFALLIRLFDNSATDHVDSNLVKLVLPVALLMLCWANMHGGVVVGQALLVAYLIREIANLLIHEKQRRYCNKMVLLASLAGLLTSLCTPNFVRGISVASGQLKQGNAHILANNSEYMSSLSILKTGDYTVVLVWAITGLFIVSMFARLRKLNYAFVAVSIVVIYYSLIQVRHVPFLLIMSIPVIVSYFSSLNNIVLVRISFISICCISLFIFTLDESVNFQRVKRAGWIDEFAFPLGAAKYVEEKNIKGNMFNPYLWGGYLLWHLGADRKVFVDGRVMDPKVFWDLAAIETSAAWGSTDKPLWKTMFEKYGIDYAILPVRKVTGGPYLLAAAVARDRDWRVAYQSYNSMVLVKR